MEFVKVDDLEQVLSNQKMKLIKDENAKLKIVGVPNIEEEEIIYLPSDEIQNVERVLISPKGCKIAYLLELPRELSGNTEFIVSGTNDSGKSRKNITNYEDNINMHLESKFYDILGNGVKRFPHVEIILPHYDAAIKSEPDFKYKPVYATLNLECFDGLVERTDLLDQDKFIRIDEQIRKCISNAKKYVENLREVSNNPMTSKIRKNIPEIESVSIEEKVNLFGYSQGAVFVERFSAIYPEIVSKLLTGGNAGTQLIPDDTMDYPFGTKNYKKIFGKEFDEKSYTGIQRAQFVSEFEAVKPLKSYDINGKKVEEVVCNENEICYGIIDGVRTILPPHYDGSYLPHECSADQGKFLREKRGQTLDERYWFYSDWYSENTSSYVGIIVKNCDHNSIWDVLELYEACTEFYKGNGFSIDEKILSSHIDMSAQEMRNLIEIERSQSRLEVLSNQKMELENLQREKQIELETKQADISPMKRRDSNEKSE